VKHASALLGLSLALTAWPAQAAKVFEDKEKNIAVNVGVLVQPWFLMTAPATGSGDGPCGSATHPQCSAGIGNPDGGPSFDLFLRRARIMVYGSVTKELSFFVETDEPNLGRGGTYTTSTFIQDAFLTYAFADAIKLDAGLMLVPLSHHTIEGATGLNALDYHAEMIRFPTGRIFRDVGLQARGLLFDDLIHYRLGVFQGVRAGAVPAPPMGTPAPSPLNNLGLPRAAGQIRVNFAGSEPDFFLKGIYFSPTPIVSLGVGGDFQPNSSYKFTGGRGNYYAGSVDVFAEVPFTADDELIVKANLFYYGDVNAVVPALPSGGISTYGEVGFRHDWVEPLVYLEYLKAQDDQLTILAPHVGLNFWAIKHTFNVKTDFGYRQTERPDVPKTKDLLWATQAQVFF
jgi:hypothetical protein